MKKIVLLLPFVCALLYVSLSSYNIGPGAGGAGDHTGASGTAGCGGYGCHGTSASSGTSVSIVLLDAGTPVSTYVGSHAYTIQITGTSTGSSTFPTDHFGFQTSVVKNGTTTNTGTLSAPTGGHTGTYGGIICAEHSSPLSPTTGTGVSTTTYVVNIPWTSPSAGTGCVTIFSALNAVHYDGIADAHDQWNYNSYTINEAVSPITGTTTVCVGFTTTLSDPSTCATWSSGNTSIATVGASTGVVTGVNPGTATISYSAGGTNVATTVVTVLAAPSSILGTTAACVSSGSTLSDASGLGTWTSSSTGIATANLVTGTVTGVSAGTATITFTAALNGCKTTTTFTVNPLPSSISGVTSLCPGSVSTLTDAGGGNWLSGNTSVAVIGSSSGVVTTGAAGTSIITYTLLTGCKTNITVTVNPTPSSISGNLVVCPGFASALTDATAGTWSSGNTAVATIDAGTGVVTGVAGGTAVITLTAGTGCGAIATVTVNPLPPAISGNTTICAGLTSTLTDTTGGGTWTSTNTFVATIDVSLGVVTAAPGAGGTTIITYTVPTTGCVNSTVVTVNPLPTAILGKLNLCPGTSATLSDATVPGNWTSSNTSVATIDFSSAFATGVVPGSSTITYTLGTGCIATAALTVNASPPSISGVASVCTGLTTGLSDASGGGTWVSGNTSIATIGSSSGLVTAVGSFGVSAITYTAPVTGCSTLKTVTVNAGPGSITGTATVCSGSTTFLFDGGGGSWSSSNTAIATVGSTGIVTGVGSSGTATISYTLTSTGCSSTRIVTVNPLPAVITGTTSVCTGSSTALTDATTGGTWASSNTSVATIGSTGIANGLGAGGTSALISYTLPTGCKVNTVITVNTLPGAITGASSDCVGASVSLSDGTSGGSWSSTNTSVATIGSGSGTVTGIGAGSATISYTITSTGCAASKNLTVNPAPSSITGTFIICAGSATPLSDGGGGTWKSGSTAVATVVSGTGVATGVSGGTSVITYTLPGTGCNVTQTLTVNPLTAITGITSLCSGLTSSLSDGAGGGTWTSSNTAVATIGSGSGFVTSVSPGLTTINYSLSTGCVATTTVNVVSAPSAITGNNIICLGLTSALTDAGGGTWTSSKTTVATVSVGSGVVTGASLGSATITYSLGTSCNAIMDVTVDPVPSGIIGAALVCAGSTTTLSETTTGGVWSSSNANATVGSTGVVAGVTAGSATISYTIGTGCSAFKTVTINPLPAAITGADSVCMGSTTTLSDGGSGTWSMGTTGVATVGATSGVVSPVTVGTATIIYTLPVTGCKESIVVTVNPLPLTITGSTVVCVGASSPLSDGSFGGTWTTSNTNASVDATSGVVTGMSAGPSTVIYTLSTGCSTSKTGTVNPLPATISGVAQLCVGNATPLSDGTRGGKWTSGSGNATIGSTSGIAVGAFAGTATVMYTLTATGCASSVTLTVEPLPSAIMGATSVCVGLTTALTDTTSGGTWTTSNTGIATVGSASGVVTGTGGGTATITYTLGTGCAATMTITVNPLPLGITGASTVCVGAATALTDASSGGTWTSGNTGIATVIAGSGVVTGVSAGTSIITYALGTGCEAHYVVTVNSLPPAIVGTPVLCAGAVTTLSDTTGGAWSSGNTAVATVGTGSGDVSGIAAGTATISFSLAGCVSVVGVTVNPLPASIAGTAHICSGLTATLSDGTGGGSWSSGTTTVATIGTGSGLVTTTGIGVTTIAYTLSTGCSSSVALTVNPLPSAITGANHVCVGATTALTDAGGGTWRSSNVAVATVVSGSGLVTGIAAGSATITYTLPTGCTSLISLTVNPLPVAGMITGQTILCVGSPITLSDEVSGGSWSSSDAAVATIDPTSGLVTGIATGTVSISYSVTNSCGTARSSVLDTVIDIPGAGVITGVDSVCVGDSVVLGDTVTGGIWSSSNGNATVSGTGTITGVTAGTCTISYAKTTICGTATATILVTVKSAAACKVGVGILPEMAEFKVYPNPSSGSFIVQIPETTDGSTITILDVLGKVIAQRNIKDTKMQKVSFDLLNVVPGSYTVKVNAGNNTYRQKIVIW